jgi:hypothetical protein
MITLHPLTEKICQLRRQRGMARLRLMLCLTLLLLLLPR